ncbi:amino acid adenylation domain-containing protein [Kribbella sp. NBC_00382]|uniref:amino acid adenylation domain-containing protein n=1 Tax=Kribbella sp. NBC_00382 TaxID=2975967 RepID=UPI002E1DF3CA
MRAVFSAWLIGGNSLVVECASVLAERGHWVCGVASEVPEVRELAAERGFHVAESLPAGEPFDVLFSVVHLRMLPAEVLALPRRMAVNFHDAVLPRDAGVNAAAWAVADRRNVHGITWHVMTEEADAGDVLAQRSFPVTDGETSHSLNLKCLQAGLESFTVLVDELAEGNEQRTSQDLSQRSYHGRLDRPGLMLSWRRTAVELEALVRATDFGPGQNRFGMCRVRTADAWLLVRSAQVCELWSSEPPPGTVVAVEETAIRVATGAGDLLVEVGPHELRPGVVLPEPDEDATQAERVGLQHEGFWRRRLRELRPLRGLSALGTAHRVELPAGMTDLEVADAAVAYLAELTGEDVFDIGLRTPAHGLLSEVVPFRIGQQIRTGYLRDLLIRQPSLAAPQLPVLIEVGTESAPAPGTELVIRIRDGVCTWLTDNPDLAEGFAAYCAADGTLHAPLVSAATARRLLADGEASRVKYPRDLRTHELFAEQANARPGDVAVVFAGQQLSYGELDERSGRLAALLAEQGVGPGDRVGVYLERSADLLVTLLAVWKAGAAYVPLDPVYPAARIAYMLADAQVALLVTQASLEHNAPGHKVILDRCALPDVPFPSQPGRADDLAYVIYTSGSTGRPKGVQVTHRGLTNFLCSMATTPGFTAADQILAITTICFDIAGLELFLPLITGGTVEIAPAGVVGDGPALRDLLAVSDATVLQATPVTWRMLIDAGWTNARGLRLLCGGEALPRDLAAALLARADTVWNLYGPTETTIWSTAARVRPGEDITIGRPIANTTCHVLDQHMRLLPQGLPGELYIGGDGVAQGYRNRPDLSAERFVPDPFGPGTLYRTGDLVRRLPNGDLECLGRADHQIKLHGHRIEPGEIEAVLREVPAVRNAVVVVRDDRLIGYLTPTGHDLAALRETLRSRLPGYMVPAALVELDELPETPNGKLDRNALPDPAPAGLVPAGPVGVEILETLEDLLGAVCVQAATVLGTLEPVEADQRFPDVGIDSLAAAALLGRLHTLTGIRLTVTATFQHPTPRQLAGHLHQLLTGTTEPEQRPDLAVQLAPEIVPAANAAHPTGDECLVTGATGFVGAFLVRELADRGRTVHCLVRGADAATAHHRLRTAMDAYDLWDDDLEHSVRVHPGDLSQPLLGLTETDFDDLAATVETVYHCGAHVSAVHPYAALQTANVAGTQEALRLAARHHPSIFHHISTIEVFAEAPAHGGPITPSDPPGPPDALRGGYAQTKWAAEHLVRQADQRGLPTAIHRLPRILGHTRTGACQTRDLLWQILKGCIQSGTVPTGIDASYDLVPVDHIARATADATPGPGKVLHLTNPHRTTFNTIISHLRTAGYTLTDLPLEPWTDQIRNHPGNAAAPVLDIFLTEMTGHGWSDLTFTTTLPDHPPLSSQTFMTYVDYFARTGYLPKPAH